jgi:hypothetical protein
MDTINNNVLFLQCGVGEGKMRIFQNHPGYEAVG